MSSYPPSTLAYPLLNQLLDSFLPFSVSSTSSTFALPSSDASPPLSVASLVSSTSAVQLPPVSSLLTTTASTTLPVHSSSLQPPVSMTDLTPLHPKDAVATSPNLQQYSAVRQLNHDLQRKNHGTPDVHSYL